MTQRPAEHSVTGQMVTLFGGRGLAFLLSFAVPLVLVRLFPAEAFGFYKQVLLIHTTTVMVLTLGIPASLFYFLPMLPGERREYILQALLVLGAAGLLSAAVLTLLRVQIARALNNGDLEAILPYVAAFTFFALIASVLETLMIILKQAKLAAITSISSELLRAVLVIGAAVMGQSITAVIIALLGWAAVRVIALLLYLRTLGLSGSVRPSVGRLGSQIRYAIPFAGAVLIQTVTESVHQYAVAWLYTPAIFAIYAIGYLQIPVVGIAFASVNEVALVRLTEMRRDDKLAEGMAFIGSSALKLWLILFPLYVWLMVSSSDLVTLLYTERFGASVPLFRVFVTTIPLTALALDYVPRAFGETRFLLGVNLLQLGLSVLLIGALVPPLGLFGAALATVLALAAAKVVILLRVAILLRSSVRDVVPWGRLGRIAGSAAVAGAAAALVEGALTEGGVGRVALSGSVFALCYGVLIWNRRVLNRPEKERVRHAIRGMARPLEAISRGLWQW